MIVNAFPVLSQVDSITQTGGMSMNRMNLFFATIMLAAIPAASFAQTETIAPDHVPAARSALSSQPTGPNAASPAPVQPLATAPHHYGPVSFRRDGVWFSTADGSTHLQVHGYAQADNRMFSSNTRGQELDTFLFRRIRPLFEGTLFNQIDFRVMPDFGQYNPQIQEAYLELKTLPFAKLRVGKFKEPIGLEVLRQDRDLSFTERSIASDLLPLRYLGAQLSGSVLGKSINYEAGYFQGSSDGSNAVFTQWTHGNEGVGRIFLQPFATTSVNVLKNFGFGVAGSAGAQHGTIAGLKTMSQSTFFKYSSGALADGQHNRLSPQAYYYAGPFGAIAEYAISSQDVLNKGQIARLRNEGWEVQGSVMLTGDKNSYAGFHPHNGFEPNRGFRHLGAVELAVRFSQLGIDPDAFPLFASAKTSAQRARATGIGLNWHLNRYVKLMTDYEHTTFRMASVTATPLHNENVLISRIQLGF
jgi:phosphate-selective porin OprO and OprP